MPLSCVSWSTSHTLEANIAAALTAVKDCQLEHMSILLLRSDSHDANDTLDDLSSHNCRFVQAFTEKHLVKLQAASPQRALHMFDKVPTNTCQWVIIRPAGLLLAYLFGEPFTIICTSGTC